MVKGTTQKQFSTYWRSPGCSAGIHSKGATTDFSFGFTVQKSIENGPLKGGYHQFLYCCVFNQEMLNLRGAQVIWTSLHLLHTLEIQMKSNHLSKHSPSEYMYF